MSWGITSATGSNNPNIHTVTFNGMTTGSSILSYYSDYINVSLRNIDTTFFADLYSSMLPGCYATPHSTFPTDTIRHIVNGVEKCIDPLYHWNIYIAGFDFSEAIWYINSFFIQSFTEENDLGFFSHYLI